MSSIGSRLREEREYLGRNQESFAALGGVKRGAQANYESDIRRPDADYFAAIAHAVDVQYIITGERSVAPQSQRSIVGSGVANRGDDEYRARFVLVPRYYVEVSAGHGAMNDPDEILEHMAFQREWLRAIGVEADSAAVVMARGDSMEPLISSGDLVVVDRTQQQLVDGVFVIRREDRLIIKRVQDLMDGSWMLKSENDAYDPIVISHAKAGELHVVGRARYTWAGRRL